MKIPPVRVELLLADGWKDGRTDRHEETNSRSSEYYERAKKLSNRFKLLTQADGSKQISAEKKRSFFRDRALCIATCM